MIDQKEQAWLRLKACELVTHGWHEKQSELVRSARIADALYQWSVTGELPGPQS